MTEAVDVLVETVDGACFQFASILMTALTQALDKAVADGAALSLVSLDSAALVIPWSIVQRVSYVPVVAEEEWEVLWDSAQCERRT